MVNRRKFLRGMGLAAVSVTIPVSFWGCSSGGKPEVVKPTYNYAPGVTAKNEEVIEDLEFNTVLTQAEPGKWAGKEGSHIPQVVLKKESGSVELFTKHGMSTAHWIQYHYIRDQDGKLIGFKEYKGTDSEARGVFSIPKGTTSVTAYSYCNRHDNWVAKAAST